MKTLLLGFLLAAVISLRAEPPVTEPSAVAAQYHAVLQQEEYRHDATPDFFSKLGHWTITVLQSLQDSFKHYEYSGQLVRLSYALMGVIFALGVASLLYWSVNLLRLRYSFAKTAAETPLGQHPVEMPESFENELRHAVTAQLWTTAVLLSWRRFLSRLEEHRLVTTDRTRTNWEYLAQLQTQTTSLPTPTRDLCRELVAAYDRHIYGAHAVTPEEWTQWDAALDAVTRSLKLDRPITPTAP